MLETLNFDPASEAITSLRSKEEAHDYRYFPEPDLVPLVVGEQQRQALADSLPELPAARAERFERELGLVPDRARELAFRREQADYFERALSFGDAGRDGAVAIANWMPELVSGSAPTSTRATAASSRPLWPRWPGWSPTSRSAVTPPATC